MCVWVGRASSTWSERRQERRQLLQRRQRNVVHGNVDTQQHPPMRRVYQRVQTEREKFCSSLITLWDRAVSLLPANMWYRRVFTHITPSALGSRARKKFGVLLVTPLFCELRKGQLL